MYVYIMKQMKKKKGSLEKIEKLILVKISNL